MDFSPAWERLKDIATSLIASIPNLLMGFLVFIVFLVLAQAFRSAVQRAMAQRRQTSNVGLVLGRLAQGFILIAGLLVAITVSVPSFTPADLVGTLGIGSVAIGFAFRDILQNFLAGILILLTEPFHIHDQIVFGAFEGTVEDIQTRATIMRTYDGRRVVIPNADLFMHAVTVNTAYAHRRMQYDIEVDHSADVDAARHLILATMRSIPEVLTDPEPNVLVVALTASGVSLRARWWVAPPRRADVLLVQDQVLTAVKQAFGEHNIAFPSPVQQISMLTQDEQS